MHCTCHIEGSIFIHATIMMFVLTSTHGLESCCRD
jgi:hypothetical protein